jgi:hypothetical protein
VGGEERRFVLLGYPLDPNEGAHRGDYHPFNHFHAAGKSRADVGLVIGVKRNLAICAVAIPAKITIRDRIQRQKLEATQQPVLFGHLHPLAQHFDANKPFIGIE